MGHIMHRVITSSNRTPRHATVVLVVAILLASLGWSTTTAIAQGQATQPLRVVATVGMIGDVARHVGGECVSVEVLMGPGSDPHLYRASAGDVRRLRDAQLILYGGLGLEGQLGQVLAGLSDSTPTVAVSEL